MLGGAGALLEGLEAIWLEGSGHSDGLEAEVFALLEASSHCLESGGAHDQLWQLDRQRLLERVVVLLTQEGEELLVKLTAQTTQTAEQRQQQGVLAHERNHLLQARFAL